MTLVQAAAQARFWEHEGELSLAVPSQLPTECEIRKCVVCKGMIDLHPGMGRKPLTCGRVACKRGKRRINHWKRKNARTRLLMAARFAEVPASSKNEEQSKFLAEKPTNAGR